MIELLESRGMVTYVCKGAPRMAKVSLRMDEDEVGMAFGDKAMLGAIIDDVTCICKCNRGHGEKARHAGLGPLGLGLD